MYGFDNQLLDSKHFHIALQGLGAIIVLPHFIWMSYKVKCHGVTDFNKWLVPKISVMIFTITVWIYMPNDFMTMHYESAKLPNNFTYSDI